MECLDVQIEKFKNNWPDVGPGHLTLRAALCPKLEPSKSTSHNATVKCVIEKPSTCNADLQPFNTWLIRSVRLGALN